jgi:hypothetical protein
MPRQPLQRATTLLAAAAYLLALVASNLSHVHVHPLVDAEFDACSQATTTEGFARCVQDADRNADPDGTVHDAHHGSGEAPASHHDDCNICRFLGRPILLVKPFELTDASEPVVSLPALGEPALRPVIVVVTHARAPPNAAPII